NILSVALEHASRGGWENLRFGELAKELKMSKSGLFAHFKSKENLQIMVFDLASKIFSEKVMQPALKMPRGIPRIKALVEYWINWSTTVLSGGCPIIAATVEFDDKPCKMKDYVQRTQQNWIKGIAYAAQLAKDEGQFKQSLDTEQFAFELYSFMLGFHMFKRMLSDPKSIKRKLQAVDDLIEKSKSFEFKTMEKCAGRELC
ncbi:MAG: helix-turn-helix transcriptional regulator, partial [Oligoflexales bacterium]|nr:helix-turn-helix transcriptional regulator [Oligoflexales bacterium]